MSQKQLMILAIKKSRAPEAERERASIQFLLSEFLHARANFKRRPRQHFPEARLDSWRRHTAPSWSNECFKRNMNARGRYGNAEKRILSWWRNFGEIGLAYEFLVSVSKFLQQTSENLLNDKEIFWQLLGKDKKTYLCIYLKLFHEKLQWSKRVFKNKLLHPKKLI